MAHPKLPEKILTSAAKSTGATEENNAGSKADAADR
jgi:hypothetical protein